MNDRRVSVSKLTWGAVVGALYVVLTSVSAAFGLSSGVIQIRLSEALCVMPVYSSSAVGGLFVGCILANLFTGCSLPDIIFGSIATLIGSLGAYALRKHKYLAFVPNVVANTIIIPIVLVRFYKITDAIYYIVFTVGIGEIISSGVLGFVVINIMKRIRNN